MRNLKYVIEKLEKFAPPHLALFDHVGLLQGDLDQDITKIGLTLDYSLHAIQQAIDHGCDLLITHHGPTSKEYSVTGNNLAKQSLASASQLAVYRCHLSLDFCEGGIIEELCKLLDIPAKPVTTTYGPHTIHGGVGLAEDYPMTLDKLLVRARALGHPYVRIAGKKRTNFKRIAVTSGKGFVSEFFDQLKPEVYIAGEFEQEATKYAEDLGIMLVELSHHASESKPLEAVAKTLEIKLEVPVVHI
jgi:dinuclear metal center YbgI/SA1388 family protein